MNYKRVIIVGLIAGVLLNLLGWFGNAVLLREWWQSPDVFKPNAEAAEGLQRVVYEAISFVSDFVIGIVLTWMYAAMIPRLGKNFATALEAGFAIWITAVAMPYLGMARWGVLPGGLALATSMFALVTFVPGCWLIHRLYRDETAAA